VVHRDLKAENIFFSTGTHCKVGDFGFATVSAKGQLLSTFCGSPPYGKEEEMSGRKERFLIVFFSRTGTIQGREL
jgi:serine/threonine protein kinase